METGQRSSASCFVLGSLGTILLALGGQSRSGALGICDPLGWVRGAPFSPWGGMSASSLWWQYGRGDKPIEASIR